MPTDSPANPPKVSIAWTARFLADLEEVYEEKGVDADDVRNAMLIALEALKRYEWDAALITKYGIIGDTFSYNFHDEYVFTFKVVTDRDEQKHPIQENSILKRLLEK